MLYQYYILAQMDDGPLHIVSRGMPLDEGGYLQVRPLTFDSPSKALDFGCDILAPDYQFLVVGYPALVYPESVIKRRGNR